MCQNSRGIILTFLSPTVIDAMIRPKPLDRLTASDCLSELELILLVLDQKEIDEQEKTPSVGSPRAPLSRSSSKFFSQSLPVSIEASADQQSRDFNP